MRKTLTTTGAALTLTLALAGCGGPGVDSVELSGDPAEGTAPSVTFKTPINVEEDQVKVLREGEGPEIDEGDAILLEAALYKGSDGAPIQDTYATGQGQVVKLEPKLRDSIPKMYDALLDAREGAIIAYSSPQTAGKAGDESTSVEVFEVARKIPTEIEGQMKDSPEGLPKVTENVEGMPTVAKPEGKAPGKLVSEYLIEGDGEEVAEGDTVIAHYVGVKWSDGKAFDSSYEEDTPVAFPLGNVIKGWQKGLVGKKTGSRVILSVPADQAYGTEKELGENPNDYPAGDLLFVVDVLAAQDTPEAPAAPTASPSPSATQK